MKLESIVARLITEYPPYNNVPDQNGYINAVVDAISDFSRRTAQTVTTTINIVVGVDTYPMPVDCFKIIGIVSPIYSDKYIVTDRIIPVPINYAPPKGVLINGNLILDSVPLFAYPLSVRYAKGIVIGEDNEVLINSEQMGIIILRAAYTVLSLKASNTAQDSWIYTVTNETIDKRAQASAFRSQANSILTEYNDSVTRYNGTLFTTLVN